MTTPCSCSWPSRSEWLRLALLAALVLVVSIGGGRTAGDCADCGSVEGSVRAVQALIRDEGPKHDRDVVIFLEPADRSVPPAVDARAEMDQKGLVFVPHVLAVQRGTTVTFLNSDNEQHNVYFLDDVTGETLDIGTWGPGVSVDHPFTEPGVMITLCKLHLEMAAFVVVADSPWHRTIQLDGDSLEGRYAISGVPAGRYRLTAWHKKLKQKGGVAEVTVTAGKATVVDVVITKAKYANP